MPTGRSRYPTASSAGTAVIFDCDGTLVDSEPLARTAWERSLAPHGYAIDDADYASLIGLPYLEVHGFFAARIPGLAGRRRRSGRATRDRLFALIDADLTSFPDALETVREVRARGLAVAVASSSPRARLDRTLARAGLADAFAVTVAGDEIEHGKPAPDMFLAAAERLGVEPCECVAIEDSPPGVAASLAAGMYTVGVARDPADAAGLADAHVVVERLTAGAILDEYPSHSDGNSSSIPQALRAPPLNDAVCARRKRKRYARRNVRRQPPASRSAENEQPASAATAATSIGASGSVASTTSAAPGGTPASARRALTAGSGQARPRASSVVSIRSEVSMIAVILASGDLDRLYTGLSLLVSAAAEGEPARGLATFAALGAAARRALGRPRALRPEESPRSRVPGRAIFARTLAELRDVAAELPDCRIWACAAAVETTGATRADVEARLDGVLSTPRFLREIGDARLVVV